jgi:hypothetical protein
MPTKLSICVLCSSIGRCTKVCTKQANFSTGDGVRRIWDSKKNWSSIVQAFSRIEPWFNIYLTNKILGEIKILSLTLKATTTHQISIKFTPFCKINMKINQFNGPIG